MKTIDVRDLACPGPVLKLRELLNEGEREITMHVADELCRSNVTRFAASRNAEAEVEDPGDGTFVVRINAGGDSTGARSGEEVLMVSEVSRATVGPRV
ncbi:MAG: sulfurtransferase TusA family protein, partial [Acidobacteriota bacterium]|nr:sulfurtransferase TusA family protein [Acidobacteriota bacterium]